MSLGYGLAEALGCQPYPTRCAGPFGLELGGVVRALVSNGFFGVFLYPLMFTTALLWCGFAIDALVRFVRRRWASDAGR